MRIVNSKGWERTHRQLSHLDRLLPLGTALLFEPIGTEPPFALHEEDLSEEVQLPVNSDLHARPHQTAQGGTRFGDSRSGASLRREKRWRK